MAAAAAAIAGRSTSTFVRTIFRTTTTRRVYKVSFSTDSVPANFTLRCQTRALPAPSPSRLVRRELSSLVPVHTAISAACLVSKLPSQTTTSNQGRFANYISPI